MTEVIALIYSIQPERFATAEGALAALQSKDRVPDQAPLGVLSELLLPGTGGLALFQALKAQAPAARCALFTVTPPTLAPGAAGRFGLQHTIAKRAGWTRAVVEWLAPLAPKPPTERAAQLLTLIAEGQAGFEPLAERIYAGVFQGELELLALRYLASAFERDPVLTVLERVILQDSTSAQPAAEEGSLPSAPATPLSPRHTALHEIALGLSIELGGAGFEIIEEIALSYASSAKLRGRAMRHLAELYPHEAVVHIFERSMMDSDPLIRLEASEAIFESAVRAQEPGVPALASLVQAEEVADSVRIKALEHLCTEQPRAQVKSLLHWAMGQGTPELQRAASRLTMKGDGLDVDSYKDQVEDASLELSERVEALKAISIEFPKAVVLPILEHYQGSNAPELQRAAFEFAMRRASTGFEDTIARAVWGGESTQRAALLGAMQLGHQGRAAITAIAEHESVEPVVRAMALRMLGLRFVAASVVPTLEKAAFGRRFSVAEAALLAAVQLGPPGTGLLQSAVRSAQIPAVRELALRLLDQHSAQANLQSALNRAIRDRDPQVQATAVEIATRRAGEGFSSLLEKLLPLRREDLLRAALEGALDLQDAGFGPVAALALRGPRAVQIRALWHLINEFAPEDAQPVLQKARRLHPELLAIAMRGPQEPEAPQTPQPRVEDTLSSLPARLDPRQDPQRHVKTGPARPAQQHTGMPPVGLPHAGGRREVERTEDLQRAASKAGRALSPPPEAVETEPARPAKTAEAPAADWGKEVTRYDMPSAKERSAKRREERPQAWEVAHTRPTEPVEEPKPPASTPAPKAKVKKPPAPRGPIEVGRARHALSVAMRQGRNGYKAIRTLAEHSRVPKEVRIQALRQLGANFPDKRDVARVIERLITSDDPHIQSAALGCATVRDDTRFETIKQVIESDKAALYTKVRAVRFLSGRFKKSQVNPLLETLFESPIPAIRRSALEAIFTSLRYVPEADTEKALVNLLEVHESIPVKISAAKALGAFGTKRALDALARYTKKMFADGELKDAARIATARIDARLNGR